MAFTLIEFGYFILCIKPKEKNTISSFIQGGDEFQKLEFIDRALKETYWDI